MEDKQYYYIEILNRDIVFPKDWVLEKIPSLSSLDEGGTLVKLNRAGHIPLAPRIEIILEPKNIRMDLDHYLNNTIKKMEDWQKKDQISISSVIQRKISMESTDSYELRYEFIMNPLTHKIFMTQITRLVFINGYGVTINAVGRKELFDPLVLNIKEMIKSLFILKQENIKKNISNIRIHKSTLTNKNK